jgi:deoxyribodipyrimidine photo-lyase
MQERIKKLNDFTEIKEKQQVVYWMSRDQRVDDNWALIFSDKLSRDNNCSLKVVFNLTKDFLNAQEKQYNFMLKGLKSVEEKLKNLGIEFILLKGNVIDKITKYIKENNVSAIVTDFDPLKIKVNWKKEIINKIEIPFFEVDTHNIVPVWNASPKQEFAAYTLRPKINHFLGSYLKEIPKIKKRDDKIKANTDWEKLITNKENYFKSGEKNAKRTLKEFIENKLDNYSNYRNDPSLNFVSNLSPYLHFGQISSQRVALEIIKSKKNEESKKSFLEELIVRKELADNYCHYNKDYDNFNGFPNWAKKTLNEHKNDNREYIYSLKELEESKTHDPLWNAAQKEMIMSGKMHGYLRMYWAKKILEWSKTPEEAQKHAIYLNDKHSLDGRDANGYTGIAWSLGGVHDRAWNQRAIFGKIRFMSFNSTSKKFNLKKYLEKIDQL